MEQRSNRRSSTRRVIAVALAIVATLVISGSVLAQTRFTIEDIGGSVGLGTADLKETIINVIRWVLGILALVAVSFIMYGGYLWLTAAGNVERIQKAKRVILNAVIGLVIVLISWAIVSFVAKTFLKVSSGSPTIKPPICFPGSTDPRCAIGTVGFEIRSITTDCENADLGDYRHNVFLCSAINVTFNRVVNGATVQNAVEVATPKLVVEKCDDENCALPTLPADSALDGYPRDAAKDQQLFTDTTPSRAGAEWVARLDNTAKNMTFFHIPTLLEANTWYRVTIPKTIEDTLGRKISACRKNTADPGIEGCVDGGTAYTWIMQTGTEVDTTAPKVSSAYPDVRYLLEPGKGYTPDQSVPRTPLINLMYDQAILPPTRVEIISYSDPPDPTTGAGGTLGSAVNPADYTVAPLDDGRSVFIAVKNDKPLDKFTWYKVVVSGVLDLCSNAQSPEPFEWVFETNDTVAGIADHYPQNDTKDACEDTPVFIRYTISMYDPQTSNCQVNPDTTVGSYVTAGYLDPIPATGTKALNVDPSNDPDYRCNRLAPGERCPYEELCKVYSFKPDAPDSVLNVNTTYKVGVDNRYQINDAGDTLRFGEGLPAGPPSLGDWHFDVKPAGECVNRPVITRIDPPEGTDGQCLTVNGYNFDPDKSIPARKGGDDLQYDGATQPDLAWSDQAITTEAPGGLPLDAAVDPGEHLYKVKAEFPAPFGVLESNEFPWTKKNGPDSTGPCLISLDPNAGFRGSDFKAKGKRFNPGSSTKKINFSGASNPSFILWKDEEITNIVVPADAVDDVHDVSVENDAGRSNALPYTVKPIPPDQPTVISSWPSCASSCLNADIGAQFSVDIDPASLNAGGAVALKQCDNENCNSFSGGALAITVEYDGIPGIPSFKAHVLPQASLDPGKWYRVILKNSIKGSTAPANGNLGGLNFDEDANGANDAYSWTFKTAAAGAEGCALNKVTVSPKTATMRKLDETKPYSAEAFTEPNECSASGQLINPELLGWDWTADASFATVAKNPPPNPPDDDWNAIVTAKNETVPETTQICSRATDSSRDITKKGCGTLNIDFAFCEDDTDCVGAENQCPDSTCDQVTDRCSPLIKNIQPLRGEIGTWVQVNGCYFGRYIRGACTGGSDNGQACDSNQDCSSKNCQGGSAVFYTDNKRGRWPNPPLCGAPSTQWGQTTILSEVPDRDDSGLSASDGALAVQREDRKVSNPSSEFTVDPLVTVPGICKITPRGGAEGTDVTLFGQNFGTKDPSDKVVFYREHDASCVGTWTETEVMCRAPNGIENNSGTPPYAYPADKDWGTNEVSLLGDNQWSNVVNFDVTPPGCSVCSADTACIAPTPVCGYGRGGAPGCCVAKPKVTDTNPDDGQINVCRNSIVTATFDRAMDGNTMTKSSVQLFRIETVALPGGGRGSRSMVTGYAVTYDGASRTVSIVPPGGMLDKDAKYKVVLSSGAPVKSAEGGALDQLEWTFTSANTDGPCKLTRCEVSPSTWIFPQAGSKTFKVRALSDGGAVVSEVPGVYEWQWEWSIIEPPEIADFNSAPGDADTAIVDSKPVKGNTVVKATAKPLTPALGHASTVLCSTSIKSTACEKPWIFEDSVDNCSLAEAGVKCTTDFHFKMDYCMDDKLPNLNFDSASGSYNYTITATRGTEQNSYLLKEFLFKEVDPNVRDAIGIRIYDNTEGLSAPEWYKKFAPNPSSLSALAVDGYDAIKDGTTVYVAATNYDGSNFQNLIYLISYNQGAASNIVNTYNQLLGSWFFNTNVTTMCNGVESDKVCVQRDLKRLAALKDALEYLRTSKTKNSVYPKLESGSYLPQLSFSVWPSWQQTLGNELGKRLTLDPKNKIVNCPATQAQDGTCWNETDKKFICPSTGVCVGGEEDGDVCSNFSECGSGVCEKSHILGYQAKQDGSNVTLYANLEYAGGSWLRPPLGTICSTPSDCQCFNYYVNP